MHIKRCFGLILGLLSIFLFTVAIPHFTPSRLVVPIPEYIELGTVREGKQVAEFSLQNNSGSRYNIIQVKSTCGCTDVDLSDMIIPPQDHVKGMVTWNTLGLNGETEAEVYLWLQDMKSLERIALAITLKATVFPEYEIPDRIYLYHKGPRENTFAVTPRADLDVCVLNVYTDSPHLELRKIDNLNFSVRLSDSAPSKAFQSEIMIETDSVLRPKSSVIALALPN